MANEESSKFSSSNLKVPPLKIVLSSHQNNAVVNISSIDDDHQFKSSNDKGDHINDRLDHKELVGRSSIDMGEGCDKHHKKNSKSSSERNESESGRQTGYLSSSSSSSSSSDSSTSSTPSSESESLASNSTIISEQQQPVKTKTDIKEENSASKQDRSSRHAAKVSSVERSSNSQASGKRSHDGHAEQSSDNTVATANLKEQSLNANQRITRSSQRAAQQNKSENLNDSNIDELMVTENQDKVHESARKAKRRKGEPQESEQDSGQVTAQPPIAITNFYPADYQLPSQNSFELYRDIRKRPYKKLMKLSCIQPRVPHGFKDYLINGGPYLLDGNKLGVGLYGSRIDNLNNGDQTKNGINSTSRVPLRMKLSNLHKKLPSYQPSQQRHNSYIVPKILEVPKNLPVGSALYELFKDQEKSRQQMRMQHLKERERSILAAEQEILRAYNKAAIADVRQKLHLSACTYFYYQERYHYLEEKSGSNGNTKTKEVPHSQDNSFLCIEGGEAAAKSSDNNNVASESSGPDNFKATKVESSTKDSAKTQAINESTRNNLSEVTSDSAKVKVENIGNEDVEMRNSEEVNKTKIEEQSATQQSVGEGPQQDLTDNRTSDTVVTHKGINSKSTDTTDNSVSKDEEGKESDKNAAEQTKHQDLDSDNSISESSKDDPTKNMSDEDLKVFNQEIFLTQLQEIDDKWEKIKKDMLVRHKNEADSLHAVQSLEWEWKAKEIGACDVRVSLKIEPEFVPRVEVVALDY